MFHFYWPWFALLLPLPFLIRKIIPANPNEKDAGSSEIFFPAIQRMKQAFPVYSQQNQQSNRFFFILLFLTWICLIVALMQPEKVDSFRHETNKGYDLMLAVDISASMQAVDFSTGSKAISRLDATKEVVGKFALGRQGDRVGLIAFGESAYLPVPLTLDTVSVSHMLNHTVSGMAGNATAIGDAIGLSIRTLRERPEGSRILILLTDGEDNASSIPPLEAAKIAKEYGIRIYTIGIGKKGPVPFPSRFGGYEMVEVSMDENLLKEIASMTGGHYFSASNQKVLEAIYEKIDKLEKTESDQTIFLIREPFYQYPLSLALIFFFILSIHQIAFGRMIRGS